MNIYQIKADYEQANPQGRFFDKDNLRFAGQTMRDFKVVRQPDGNFRLTAPLRHNSQLVGQTVRIWNPTTKTLFLETKG